MKTRFFSAMALLCIVSACSGGSDKAPYKGVKIGKPYQIYGRWYKPQYEADYDEVGMASWYGPGFHGKSTANGERYNQHEFTAAHRTLPLPSVVRVTNLDNGKSAIVRVNDRGPFARNRIIDLSKATAEQLGVIKSGTAKVRVQFLDQETKQYVDHSNGQGIQYAMNKLKAVDPAEAASIQENRNKPQFYVMKVPDGKTPPPSSIPVSQQDAARYPTRDIFEAADIYSDEETANEPAAQEMAANEELSTRVIPVRYLNTSGIYYVQAGTFGLEANAHRLADRLDEQVNAKVINMSYGGRTLYRVMIGPYDQAAPAKNMLSKLSSLGISDAKIVRN